MSKKKLIHILGGSFNQLSLIKKAKAMGLGVLVTDLYENPPAKPLVDHFEQMDVRDLQGTLKISEKYQINAITTDQVDVAVPTVAFVAEKLSLPGIGYETALKFTNKNLMKDALRNSLASNIPFYSFAKNSQEALQIIRDFKFKKLIVKPVDSQGSRGVIVIEQEADNEQTVMAKLEASFSGGFGAGINIEEFIEGEEYAVDAFSENGVHNLTIAAKKQYPLNPCLDQAFYYFGEIDREIERRLFDVNSQIIKSLGLVRGVSHAEYKIKPDGTVVLMEIAARGAGSGINGTINPFLTQFDINQAILNQAIGETNDIEIANYRERFATVEWFNFKPGKIKAINVHEDIYKLVAELNIKAKKGDIIIDSRDSRDRAGYMIVTDTTSKANVLNKLEQAKSLIEVIYE